MKRKRTNITFPIPDDDQWANAWKGLTPPTVAHRDLCRSRMRAAALKFRDSGDLQDLLDAKEFRDASHYWSAEIVNDVAHALQNERYNRDVFD